MIAPACARRSHAGARLEEGPARSRPALPSGHRIPEHSMPIRIASLARQLKKSGQRLHHVIASRAFSQGADQPGSDAEKALREERSALKAAQAERREKAKLPKVKAAKVVKAARPAKA